jgi:chemotaxis protein methyltransferase CheR
MRVPFKTFKRFEEIAHEHGSLVFKNKDHAEAGVTRRAMALHMTHEQYLEYLEGNSSNELPYFIGAIAPHVTAWWRGRIWRDYKSLCERHALQHTDEPLYVWSAACSTGEEALSAFITAHVVNCPVEVVGTDFDQGTVDAAIAGVYPHEDIERALTQQYRRLYFAPLASPAYTKPHVTVKDKVRKYVHFFKCDLRNDEPSEPPKHFDVILLCNVLQYWDGPLREAVLERIARRMHKGSTLYIGQKEDGYMNRRDLFEWRAASTYKLRGEK